VVDANGTVIISMNRMKKQLSNIMIINVSVDKRISLEEIDEMKSEGPWEAHK
jgi:hypothetical protein